MQAKYLFFLRAVIWEVLILERLYGAKESVGPPWLWALYLVYAAFAAGLYLADRRKHLPPLANVLAFIGDIAFTSLILYFTEDASNELYIAYFLVILASCFLDNLTYSFIVGAVSCVVYGAMAFPGEDWVLSPAYPLRLSLLLVTSFFSAYVANATRYIEIRLEERYEQQIAWMQRLSMVGQALSGVFHELKTPMNTILLAVGHTRSLRSRDSGADIGEHLSLIEQEAERAVDILSNYLEFAKPVELALTPVILRDAVEAALAAMKYRVEERGVALSVSLPEDARILGSRKHLIQVFTNLFMNSLQAMPLGGRLTVEAEAAGGRLKVVVSDNGAGIPPEMMRRLFRPFSTSREDYEGHGLGLSIVRWIVQKHSGTITIYSEGPERGARVTLDFPRLR